MDYSENLIGYLIIFSEDLVKCIPKITRLKHYREVKKRKLYIKKVKATYKKEKILECFYKKKVREILETPEIFLDIEEFLEKNKDKKIFISIDDRQYPKYHRLVKKNDGENITIVRESKLKKNTPEYRINLVLDTWLNIKRLK